MKFVFSSLILAVALIHSSESLAQLDSSYELLLGNHASPAPAAVKKEKKTRVMSSEEPATKVEIPQGPPMPAKLEPYQPPTPVAPKADEPTITQQAQSLFTANPEKVLGFYQDQFDEEDTRQNKIEISFAPSYITNESSSNFSYRNFRSVFSGMNLGASVWLTPAIGVGGNFLFSLGGDTSGDAVTGTHSPARHEFLDMALKFRQFFGFTQSSRSVEFDILYSDYKFAAPADDLYRAKTKTSGLGVKMTLKLPSSNDIAWLVGGSFYPRLQHSESKTGVDIKSGDNTENVRVGLQLGAEVKLSRRAQIFYEASAMSEKNLFEGSAKLADPATGLTPKNVSVTNNFYIFTLGYRWGN
jgi:hypothetical protein